MSTRIEKPRKPAPPARKTNRTAMVGVGAGVLGVVAAVIWAAGQTLIPDSAPPAPAQPPAGPEPASATARPEPAAKPDTRLFSESVLSASAPDPAPATEPDATADETLNIPFQIEHVAHALSQVELDDDGNVVINESAQLILEQAFMDSRVTLDEQQLEELKAVIEAGLEGPAGAQAVEVAEKFYRYSNAYREVADTLAMRTDPESLRADYEQVERLRRTHLGPELADQLYGREQQLTRYTLEIMALQSEPDLTPEQRSEKQKEIASRYPDVMPGGEQDDGAAEQATN